MASQNVPTVTLVYRLPGSEESPVDPVKAIVTKSLGLPPYLNKYWDVTDVYPSKEAPELALAHYNDHYDPSNRQHEPIRKIRGVIVDLKTGAIVADAYGYTQSLACYEPLVETKGADDPTGTIQVQTEIATYLNDFATAPEETPKVSVGTRSFDKATTSIFIGYEGALIRIFKWNGQVFFSTQRRINAVRSNWGGRTTFLALYKQMNGPDLESLFGPELYSPFCYMFLVVHNDIRIASSTRDNRIVFIGMKKVWDPEKYAQPGQPYAWTGEFHPRLPTPGREPDAFSTELNRALIIQPSINVDIANKFLFPNIYARPMTDEQVKTFGAKENEIIIDYNEDGTRVDEIYFRQMSAQIKDERLSGGDFVILYTRTPQGDTIVYRLEPSSYEYRVGITGNNPNPYNQFVTEMVPFTQANIDNHDDPIFTYPQYVSNGAPMPLSRPEQRQIYWWSLYYDAIAPCYKDEVDGFWARYDRDLTKVANFILTDYPKIIDPNNPGLKAGEERAKQILEEVKRINEDTRRRFDNLRKIARGASRNSRQAPFTVLRGLLINETGPSLYRMITTVQNIEKLRKRFADKVISAESLEPSSKTEGSVSSSQI